jgi:MoxR-like ATPase
VKKIEDLFSRDEKLLLLRFITPKAVTKVTEKDAEDWRSRGEPPEKWIKTAFPRAIGTALRRYHRLGTMAARSAFIRDILSANSIRDTGRSWDEAQRVLLLFSKLLFEAGWMTAETLDGVKRATEGLSGSDRGKVGLFFKLSSALPYGLLTEPSHDVKAIMEILSRELYGLDRVKAEVCREITLSLHAEGLLSPTPLLLAGPPGTGKSTIAEAIATALGLRFYKIGLGGHADIVALKGAHISWNQSTPGSLAKALISAQSLSFVVLLDEIDKASGYSQGNVVDVVSEILDVNQSNRFTDQYLMDIPLDLSHVFWVVTANDLSRVPGYIIDRCRVIHVPAYTEEERVIIIRDYLPGQIVRKQRFRFRITVETGVATALAHRTKSLRQAKNALLSLIAAGLENMKPGTFKELKVDKISGDLPPDTGSPARPMGFQPAESKPREDEPS